MFEIVAPAAERSPRAPARPAVRYFGGKWRIAPWIIEHFPPHRTYCEAYGGGGSVLLRKARAPVEVYNDLDGEAVNLFRVLRDPAHAEQLRAALELTPFAREEYEMAHVASTDLVERARRMLVRSFMGIGGKSTTDLRAACGFRARSVVQRVCPAVSWASWPDQVPALCDRLAGVTIENREALEVIRQQDAASTLFYLDPPYLHATRAAPEKHGYLFEMRHTDHYAMLQQVKALRGMVVISGYPCELYDDELADWRRVEKAARTDDGDAVEVLWLNPATALAL